MQSWKIFLHGYVLTSYLLMYVEKANFVIFHPSKKKIDVAISLQLNVKIIFRNLVDHISNNYLGVFIDTVLSWKAHFEYIL